MCVTLSYVDAWMDVCEWLAQMVGMLMIKGARSQGFLHTLVGL